MRFGLAAAAAALACAAPSEAAILIYSFYSTGSGGMSETSPTTGVQTTRSYIGGVFSVVIDTDKAVTTATQTTFTAVGFDRTQYTLISNAAGMSLTTLFGTPYDRDYTSTSASICFASPQPVGFLVVPVAVDQSCSSGGTTVQSHYGRGGYSGKITGFDVRSAPAGTLLIAGFTGDVPEPATWAMMIVGFGILGASLRQRRFARMVLR